MSNRLICRFCKCFFWVGRCGGVKFPRRVGVNFFEVSLVCLGLWCTTSPRFCLWYLKFWQEFLCRYTAMKHLMIYIYIHIYVYIYSLNIYPSYRYIYIYIHTLHGFWNKDAYIHTLHIIYPFKTYQMSCSSASPRTSGQDPSQNPRAIHATATRQPSRWQISGGLKITTSKNPWRASVLLFFLRLKYWKIHQIRSEKIENAKSPSLATKISVIRGILYYKEVICYYLILQRGILLYL